MGVRPDLSALATPEEMYRERQGQPIAKGETRLQKVMDERPVTKEDARTFKAAVWKRDKNRCRCCGRKVEKLLGRVPERGEVHHIHGRGKDLRFEVRAALLLCLTCHERVTGRVNDKLVIVASKTFRMRTDTFTDATFPVVFKKAA